MSGVSVKIQQQTDVDFQGVGDVKKQIERNRTDNVRSFYGTQMLSGDVEPLGELLLCKTFVLAVISDIIADFNVALVVGVKGCTSEHMLCLLHLYCKGI